MLRANPATQAGGQHRRPLIKIRRPWTHFHALARENERISTKPFLLWHFSPGDKIVAGSMRIGLRSDIQQFGGAGKSTSDYVTRRFNVSSAELKRLVGLNLRWKAA